MSDHPGDDEPSVGANIAAVVREARLELRNEELTIILDSVAQGFASVQLDGSLRSERSAILAKWAGKLPERVSYWDLVDRLEPGRGAWARMAWEQVTEGFLPVEATLAQLPRQLTRAGQLFELAYHPVSKGEALQRVVVVVTDVTSEVERQRALQRQHEFSTLVELLVRDRGGFLQFWNEASSLVRSVLEDRGQDVVQLKRNLHTLKGNLGFYGLTRLRESCHRLEDILAEVGESALSSSEAALLEGEWNDLRSRLEPLIAGSEGSVQIPQTEYARLLHLARAGAPHEQLVETLVGLTLQPIRGRLEWAKQHVQRVARTLGKTPPDVRIEEDGLRVASEDLSAFWSALVHLLNNVADHGVETDAQRRERGKPVPARLRLAARLDQTELLFELSDDGPGIDWERLAERCGLTGGAPSDASARERMLFSAGVSQREHASEISGRGAGLGAFYAATAGLKGRVTVSSVRGEGTVFRVRVPLDGMQYARISPASRTNELRSHRS